MATYLPTQSVLNVEVSCFANYNTPSNPKPVNLYLWLTNAKYRDRVLTIRAESDKLKRDALKATLPAITPSGVFTYRQASSLVPGSHSGLIQFDIDFKDNAHIRNYANLKVQLGRLPFVAYCGLSVSGTGYWGLVPIAHPKRHGQHFDALRRVFAHYRINLDDKPRNVASLRGYSYDPEGYFSEKVMLFELYDEPQSVPVRQFSQTKDADTERQRVEVCIGEISRRNIDITSGYNNWYAIGCDLASTFGEGGRDYFHIVSQCHPEYQITSCDKQYTHCLRSYKEVQLKAFFGRCRDAGITWKELLPHEPVNRISLLKNKSKTCSTVTGKTGKSTDEPSNQIQTLLSEPVAREVAPFKPPIISLVDTSISETCSPPATEKTLQNEGLIEILTVEPERCCASECEEPNLVGRKPMISAKNFHEWQCQDSYFSQMGVPTKCSEDSL
ncbi:hypothetical protein GO755_40400 [Spirosoma sp. HMF4905]|uniref:VirE protein n=1 Tax=Spirosoma arboris TaxID=2682092 RepID=A0A7K1SR91_9BACT|nr:BT4734/BF3469 family protein [Spirosoma arboris]MVM36334.1 hypothetical protein [Spirosoma arboris]